ncbi:MAG: DUF1345 domain-containing protein [Deltaproteobacteria bacterium]|nr:DUF1345 domain-containing protein [Deltaproteobacteria bacterium]
MTATPSRRAPRARTHLLLGGVATLSTGLASWLFAPPSFEIPTHVLVAFDVGVIAYLAGTIASLHREDDSRHQRAAGQDPGSLGIVLISVTATVASIVAIVAELGAMRASGEASVLHVVVCALTIVLSFSFMHTVFALHYVHVHEHEIARGSGGLRFPGTEPPDDLDFFYFAFVIGIAAQTADVAIESHRLRRLAVVHGILSFFFNTTLLALAVNAAASAF